MSEMFGSPTGFRAYDQDRAKLAQLAAETQLTQAQTLNQRRLSELNQAQAVATQQKVRMEEEQSRAIREALMRARPPAEGGEPSRATANPISQELDRLNMLGSALISGGNVEGGAKILKEAADITGKLATADSQNALRQRREVQTQVAKLDFVRQVLTSVNNPQTYQAAMMALRGNPLTVDMFADRESEVFKALSSYNQPAIDALVAGTQAAHNRAMARLRQVEVDSAAAAREANITEQQTRTQILQSRANAYIESRQRGEKTGVDRAVSPPSKTERADVKRVVREMGYELDPEQESLFAQDVAEQAKLLAVRNPALSYAEARSRVIQDSIARGELTKSRRILGAGPKDKFKFGEGTATRPVALPKSRNDLKAGTYYRGPDGSVRRFNGQAFEAVLPAGQVPNFSPATADMEDEE